MPPPMHLPLNGKARVERGKNAAADNKKCVSVSFSPIVASVDGWM